MRAMKRVALLLEILFLALALSMPVAARAQQPVNPPTPPATQPAPAQQPVVERNTTFDVIVAFAGVAVVLLIVCYPSRRY